MPKVMFVTIDEKVIAVGDVRGSLMEAAVDHGISGIGADCGGVGACGTCHVHVAPEWMERVGAASELEQETINQQCSVTPYSRLSCQIAVTENHDGLLVRIPQ
jgi:2Fe-2S ferredoxin